MHQNWPQNRKFGQYGTFSSDTGSGGGGCCWRTEEEKKVDIVYTCKKFGRFGFKNFRWNFSFIRKFKPKGQILRLPVAGSFGGNSYFLGGALRLPTDSFHSHIFLSWPYSQQIPLGSLALKIFWRPLGGARSGLGRQKYRKIAHFCHFYTKFSPFSPLNSIWMQDNARFY